MTHISDAIFKLLPAGPLFSKDSEPVSAFVGNISGEFERVRTYYHERFSEIPGALKRSLTTWEQFIGLPDSCSDGVSSLGEREQAVVARLSESGGQSLKYLSNVARKAAGSESLRVVNSQKPMRIEVLGLDLRHTRQFTARSPIRKKIRDFKRDEHVICTMERVKHAHLESRYYNDERTDHAPD